ncbi:MAG TPA: PfkB family carbohydrate kinase, partial [Casimicrobiaceae bacterium]
KRGVDGCIVAAGTARTRIAAHRVDALDATGAGDCFDGAFEARIAAGDDPFAAARYANGAAALATTGYGAVAPLPRHDDVLRWLR